MNPRLALLADYPDLIPGLARWRWEEWGHLTPDRTLEEWEQQLAQRSQVDRIPLTVVAFVKDQAVGLASLVEYDMDTRKDLSPWLAGVLVHPKYRRCGYGASLVTAIEEQAKTLGVENLYLYTNSAQGLYTKLGWGEIGREPYRGREVVIMSKVLATQEP